MHTILRIVTFALFSGLMVLLSACQAGPTSNTPATTQASAPVATQAYVLSGGDKVRINVFGENELSGEYEIDGSGAISMPLIDRVQAIGLTASQLEQKITTRLANGFLVNPKVSAEVTNYRPFYIMGEVNNPGEYPYTSGLTVLNAVAGAGGFTYRANKKIFKVRNPGSTSESERALTPTTQVGPGDTIVIKEVIFGFGNN